MYKTIIVHLSSAASTASTLRLAASLANRHGAHLIGTATSGMAELNYLLAMGAPVAMMPGVDIDALRAEAEAMLGRFEEHCRELGVGSYETRLFDVTAEEALLMQSRYCDLMVVGQDEVRREGLFLPGRLNGALVSKAARPVLLVPPGDRAKAPFKRLMVAWNGSLGASRVLAFGMPFIQAAEKVYVAVVNPDVERIETRGEPGADLSTFLARHHRNVELIERTSAQPVEAVLPMLADEMGIDLMLTGAYGHSRLHDWVLGSTTRALIDLARVPLLMSH